MAILLLVLMVACALVTGLVLADNGLRWWSAFSELNRRQATLPSSYAPGRAESRIARPRVTTRVSYVRLVTPSLRAAA